MLGEPQHIAGPHRFRGPEKPGKLRHGFLNGKHGVKQKCDRCVAACIYLYIVMCIYIYTVYTHVCYLYVYIYIPLCSMMSFSSMLSMIFGFLPCFRRLNEAWCRLGLVGPGSQAELEDEQISFQLEGGGPW